MEDDALFADQDTYQAQANNVATVFGIPTQIFDNLIGLESGWNPYAIGSSGELGLTQLLPSTADDYGVDAYDPLGQLEGGAAYLADLYKQFGNWTSALSAYNAGPDNVSSPQGQAYAAAVLSGQNLDGQTVGVPVDPTTGEPVASAQGSPAQGDTSLGGSLLGDLTGSSGAAVAKYGIAFLVIGATIVVGLVIMARQVATPAARR